MHKWIRRVLLGCLTLGLGRLMGWGAEAPGACFSCLSTLSSQEQTISQNLHISSVPTCSVPCNRRSWGIWRSWAKQIISGRQVSSSSTSTMSSKSASSCEQVEKLHLAFFSSLSLLRSSLYPSQSASLAEWIKEEFYLPRTWLYTNRINICMLVVEMPPSMLQ